MSSPRIISASILFVLIFADLLVLLTATSPDFLQCLTSQLRSSRSATDVIYTPINDASSFASMLLPPTRRPQTTSPRRPLLIFAPLHEQEVAAAIHCSKKLGLQIRLRSGGHDYEGLSYTSPDPFVIVDMRNLRSVSIDDEEKTAWVQAGATLGELYYTLAKKSRTLAFTAGVCPTVGVGGHFSGGGYGMMSRKHALAADNIIDARVMNADGEILDRKSMGEDLFWAIRGGGGTSFGVVLAFKVQLVTVPEIVTVFNVRRTLEQNATELVHRWQYIADKVDERLLIRLFLRSVRSPPVIGKRTIVASFMTLFLGRVHDLLPLMKEQFPELGLVEQDCTEMSWIDSTLFFASGGLVNQPREVLLSRFILASLIYFKGKSDYVTTPIPVQGLRGIWRFLHEEGELRSQLELSPYGGVLSNFSESETPFPHRSGNIFIIHYGVGWMDGSEEPMKWIRRLYDYMTPYVSKSPRAAYFNYRDLDLGTNMYNQTGNSTTSLVNQARVWGRKYFKNNFERLVRVKTEVDPTNFFRNEQSIPPLSSQK